MSRSEIINGNGGPVLLLSMRKRSNLVAYSIMYEFEDVITQIAGADRVDAGDQAGSYGVLSFPHRALKLVRRMTGSPRPARQPAPPPSTVRLERDYELFFPVFNHPNDLQALSVVPDWRARCRVGICYINELWTHLLPDYPLEMLSSFDHIFIGTHHCVEAVARITGRPCSYLPLAADVLRFSPWPAPPARVISVCNIGRRSPVTHEALMTLAEARKIFYYYDTVAGDLGNNGKQRTFRVDHPARHRLLLANLLQRTRYYIANRARINEPEYTAGRDEISGRFYEGAAAGAVMLGEPPNTPEFRRLFDWPNAVIPMSFNHGAIERTLADLDADPERLTRIHRDNARNAALRHDWAHRLDTVFSKAGIQITSGMQQREKRLQELAEQILAEDPGNQCDHRLAKRGVLP